jgi:hypothetical protein
MKNVEVVPLKVTVVKALGTKHDEGKLRYDLVPAVSLCEVVKVITFGAAKYGELNWQGVENARARYCAALMRHVEAWRGGEAVDPETHIHHLAHAACNCLFLLWFELTGKRDA